jgi:uncharacterized membrane protein
VHHGLSERPAPPSMTALPVVNVDLVPAAQVPSRVLGAVSSAAAAAVAWARQMWLQLSLMAASFAGYSLYSVLQYRRLSQPSWDLGIFTQIVRNYSQFHAPIENLRGAHLNALGDHFSPILAVLAPFYRLFPSPLTLDIAQAALFALAVVPITRLAVAQLGQRAGAVIGVSYSLAWGIQAAVGVDFHEIAFAVPMLAFAVEALVNQRWRRATYWSLPLLLVKEDLGLTVAAIGLYMLICHQRRRGAALIAIGLAAVVLTVGVIIPAFNPAHHYMYWSNVGSAHSTTLWSVVAHLVWPLTKIETGLLLIGVAGVVAIRSPLVIICVPTLLWRFESTKSVYWGTDWHYNAVLMPILFAAMIDGIVRARRSPSTWAQTFARYAPPVSLTVSIVLCGQFPLRAIIQPRSYAPAPAAATAAMSHIPPGSTVETNMVSVMAPLVPTNTVYSIGNDPSVIPQYLIVQTSISGIQPDPRAAQYADTLHAGATYQLIFHDGLYDVLRQTP